MKTVLVLEDDSSNMQIFCALLCSRGYRVLEATTGSEAIQIGNNEIGDIDLLVSDFQLPDCSGTDAALQLRKSHPEVSILFVSGTPLWNWAERDLRNLWQLTVGKADFLEKPFGVAIFEEKIENLLGHHATLPAFRR